MAVVLPDLGLDHVYETAAYGQLFHDVDTKRNGKQPEQKTNRYLHVSISIPEHTDTGGLSMIL